jgi:rare lipoprotein A
MSFPSGWGAILREAARPHAFGAALAGLALAGCAQQPTRVYSHRNTHEHFAEGKYYGKASARVVADGEPVPRGGGQYLVGHPYTIAGRTYYPGENDSYSAVGMASWYGDAFHGRKTANGEVYDMRALSAAHPTMPLPSYARVTNLSNGYSVIVRVNDRGPYHGGRVMDVSSRVADVLDFKGAGTAKIKVDYVGRAPLDGSDDDQLLASLRTDGSAATINGISVDSGAMVAAAEPAPSLFRFAASAAVPAPRYAPPPPPPPPQETSVAVASPPPAESPRPAHAAFAADASPRLSHPPLPPSRPFDLGATGGGAPPRPPVRLSQNAALYFAPTPSRPDPFARLIKRASVGDSD